MGTLSIAQRLNILKYKDNYDNICKRAFDIVCSSAALLILAPFFVLISFAIKRDTPGPVFYYGTRIGRRGKPFKIIKFRTMYEDPRSYAGSRVTAHDDPRITPLGHWLRGTKLNELPQLWNVLKGEMSLVGPRPEDPEFARTWPKEVFDEILSVRPGITSPASVQYRDEERMLSTGSATQQYLKELGPDKIRLDQLYVRYRSFWLDLDTVLWTIFALMPKIGAYTFPEELLFVGPVTRLIRRYVSWFTLDMLVTLAAIGVTGVIWRMSGPLNVGWPLSIMAAVGFSLLFSITGALLGTNRISWSKAKADDVFDLFPAWGAATLIVLIGTRFVHIFPLSLVMTAAGVALGGFIFSRYRVRLIVGMINYLVKYLPRAHAALERVLIIGSGTAAQHAAWLFNHPINAKKFKIVGFVDDDLLKLGMRIYGASVVGTCRDIARLVKKYDVGLLVLASVDIFSETEGPVMCFCRQTKAKLVVFPDIVTALYGITQSSPSIPLTGPSNVGNKEWYCNHCLAHYSQTVTGIKEPDPTDRR